MGRRLDTTSPAVTVKDTAVSKEGLQTEIGQMLGEAHHQQPQDHHQHPQDRAGGQESKDTAISRGGLQEELGQMLGEAHQ